MTASFSVSKTRQNGPLLAFLMNFCPLKIKRSSLGSQYWMRPCVEITKISEILKLFMDYGYIFTTFFFVTFKHFFSEDSLEKSRQLSFGTDFLFRTGWLIWAWMSVQILVTDKVITPTSPLEEVVADTIVAEWPL